MGYRQHELAKEQTKDAEVAANGGPAEARNEIDDVRWLGMADAASVLTYPADRALLVAFRAVAAPGPPATP